MELPLRPGAWRALPGPPTLHAGHLPSSSREEMGRGDLNSSNRDTITTVCPTQASSLTQPMCPPVLPSSQPRPPRSLGRTGSVITQVQREDALVLSNQGLVPKSSPKKPNIIRALFCCFHAQCVGPSSSSTELATYKGEDNITAKSNLFSVSSTSFIRSLEPGYSQR